MKKAHPSRKRWIDKKLLLTDQVILTNKSRHSNFCLISPLVCTDTARDDVRVNHNLSIVFLMYLFLAAAVFRLLNLRFRR